MSAPKPGDRVRVTFTGKFSQGRTPTLLATVVADEHGGRSFVIPGNADLEVLASPVYVNHDTTEYRPGDVVRGVNDDPEVIHVRTYGGQWVGTDGAFYADHHLASAPGLQLLVRDGQVIAP